MKNDYTADELGITEKQLADFHEMANAYRLTFGEQLKEVIKNALECWEDEKLNQINIEKAGGGKAVRAIGKESNTSDHLRRAARRRRGEGRGAPQKARRTTLGTSGDGDEQPRAESRATSQRAENRRQWLTLAE